MTAHPWVTIFRSEDGSWKATWSNPATKNLEVFVFRKNGILTAEARKDWATKKSAALWIERSSSSSVCKET